MSERNPGRYFLGAGLFGLLTGTLYMKYTNAYHELQAFNSAQPCNKLSELKDVEDGKLVLVRGKATTKVQRVFTCHCLLMNCTDTSLL